MANAMAKTVSSTVPGKRVRNSSVTGRPVVWETPKSSRSARPRNRRYCSHRGWSSPKTRLYSAILAGVARSPGRRRRVLREGTQPGEQQDDSPSRIGISWRSRRTMKRSTSSGQLSRTGRPRRRWQLATAGAVGRLGQSRWRRSRSPRRTAGSAPDPETFSATTSAFGLCEIGTAGRKSMIARLASWYSSVRLRGVRLGVGRAEGLEDLRRDERAELLLGLTVWLNRRRTCR